MATTTGKERAASRTPGQATQSGGLGKLDAAATVAVKDLDKARDFYEKKLGLTVIETEGEDAVIYQTGRSALMVYISQFAGTNKATGVTWVVGNQLDDLVDSLKAKGVRFEHYDLPETTREGDIHSSGDMRIAWFKDLDGNILAMVNR
jgi:catechol 2,3-dioxygenase-like lactoylglutathione lyase family enzyme